jgi:DNA-binding NtrC family response regulator
MIAAVPDVTETRHGDRPSQRPPPALGVAPIFREGATEELHPGMAVLADVRVGRDADVDLALGDSQASRQHALLEPDSGALCVTDLGSRNGTFVDGARIDRPRVRVRTGSTIRCGKTLLLVVEDSGAFGPGWSRDAFLVGGPRMAEVRRLIATLAPLGDPVLIEGETGTGKEKVAEAIHRASGRKGAFVPINCAAIPADLVEAEMFGHAKGAFSGSDRARAGLFRAADGGTAFLDEVGDLPTEVQPKLLRVLESGEVRPLGEDRALSIDARVVAATNASLDERVAHGAFRSDLFHRIAAWRIRIPALRDRPEDVPLLARHFLPPASPELSVEAVERLALASFPGNVRELRNAVKTAAARALAEGADRIRTAHLPDGIVAKSPAADEPASAGAADVQDAVLRARIETALALREGNVAQVARDLGWGRPWLYQTLRRLAIDPDSYRRR